MLKSCAEMTNGILSELKGVHSKKVPVTCEGPDGTGQSLEDASLMLPCQPELGRQAALPVRGTARSHPVVPAP